MLGILITLEALLQLDTLHTIFRATDFSLIFTPYFHIRFRHITLPNTACLDKLY